MREIFDDNDGYEHFKLIKEHSFKELINEKTEHQQQQQPQKTVNQPTVPKHLVAESVDSTFKHPVRCHGVEGERDSSQPFKATKKWHLELGPDGRAAIVDGEQKNGGMKLNWDQEHGVVMTPSEVPTQRPNWKPTQMRHYPGNR